MISLTPAPALSGGAWAAALLVALAGAVLSLPARRGRPQSLGPARRAAAPQEAAGGASRRGPQAGRGLPEVDIGLLLIEVAAVLRAGAAPAQAWGRALGRAGLAWGLEPDEDGVPPALRALGGRGDGSWLPQWASGRPHWRPPPRGRSALRLRAAQAAVPGAVASCRLSATLGAPLAEILEAVAEGVAESGRAESSRAAALTGPRTTARLLAGLPPVGLALGALVGADPAHLLLDGAWGSALGVVGVVLMIVGHRVTARLVRAATASADRVDEALVLDLAAASLRAGASVPGLLVALGRALEEEPLAVVGRALLLGAGWEEAWQAPDDPDWRRRRSRLEACLAPGWQDGASPISLLAATAQSLRAGRRSQDEEAAQRLAVRLVLPLGACYLPAFIILGIVPVIASVGLEMLTA
ncbi:hypothetical protein J5X07_00565 [Actinomyces bowdenii]|uniref:hypothetical protein n=1 Tax=Actinomyces bowdenii TaxID=131109 RepID=UPI001ABCC126|nr:hypothetical protein [Actinomyces bowdenii]MBO3723536.1 hypothetical protein [Actinomyces bowdenii]